MGKRKAWIDALRALAIIMVVLGHQVKGEDAYFLFTSPVKMPLFFAISGYVFNMHDGNSQLFWKNWLRRIIMKSSISTYADMQRMRFLLFCVR